MQAVLDRSADLGVSEADIRRYEEDGVICLRGVLDPGWIDRLRGATDRWLKGDTQSYSSKGDSGGFTGDVLMWRQDPDFQAVVFESRLSLIAARVMRSQSVRFFADQLFVKEPGALSKTPWHHDQTYWPVIGEGVCSIWLTLDPVTTETGGLEYVAGSHRWGRRFDPEDFGEFSMEMFRSAENEKVPDIEANRDAYRILSWDMQPGDCLVHHSLAVHGAPGNRSATIRRRAHSSRWFGDTARFRPSGPLTEELTGLKAGDPMDSPMFPLIDLTALKAPDHKA